MTVINIHPETGSIDLDDTNKTVVEFYVSRVNKTEELQIVVHHTNQNGDFETVPVWLTRKQVGRLVPYLQKFARTGVLVEDE